MRYASTGIISTSIEATVQLETQKHSEIITVVTSNRSIEWESGNNKPTYQNIGDFP